VHEPHGSFYAIVPRYILQGKGIRVGPRFGEKCVPKRMQAGIRMNLDLFAEPRHLLFEDPRSQRPGRIDRASKDVGAFGAQE
jgi:hypothetical protein